MKASTYRTLERVLITVILLSMLAFFQPWSRDLFARGFLVLLFSTLGYIILTHFSVEEASDDDE